MPACDANFDLVAVLDRSGSMYHEMDQVKSFASGVLAQLGLGTQRMGVVSFATSASVDTHLSVVADEIELAIDDLVASGTTNSAPTYCHRAPLCVGRLRRLLPVDRPHRIRALCHSLRSQRCTQAELGSFRGGSHGFAAAFGTRDAPQTSGRPPHVGWTAVI